MKVVGLITEYNPFHNGHKYHIEEAKRITGADYVVVVMSGNFVQRGAPAIIDKYSRTKIALTNGADLVFEIPACYATGSAEYFALGSVSLLDKLGIVDYLCFGSEEGDITPLQKAAYLLSTKPAFLEDRISSYMRKGITYPAARAKAIAEYLTANEDVSEDNTENILNEPNNILGIEYIKALYVLSSSITPITIKRQVAHYHDTDLPALSYANSIICDSSTQDRTAKEINSSISSATAIRRAIHLSDSNEKLSDICPSLPQDAYSVLLNAYNKHYPICEEDFLQIIKYKLLYENRTSLTRYVDITSDLADRIKNLRSLDVNFNSLVSSLKTRNLTYTRITRCLTHILLNITKKDMMSFNADQYTNYARLLGMKRSSSHLIRQIKKAGKIPVLSNLTEADKQLNPTSLNMLSVDIAATQLYNQVVYDKFGYSITNEYKHGICIL